jgi:broad specificity phosphatase PhoE
MTYSYLHDADPVTEVILVRHAQQALPTPDEPFEGHRDPLLSATGERQAKAIGEHFRGQDIHAVYSSPLGRALVTGQSIASHHALDVVIESDLREVEIFRGLDPQLTVDEYLGPLRLSGIRERMMVERRWDVFPMSESSAEFRRRVVNLIEGIATSHDNQRVVVVCHGGVINAYIGHHLGIQADMWFLPAHTSMSVMRAGSHGVRAIRTIGDAGHLAAEPELVTY